MNTLDQIPTERGLQVRPTMSGSRLFLQVTLRLLLAAVLSGALVATAVAGMMVTSAPRWVSLTLEPFSLLLFPGALAAWAEAAYNKLDFSGTTTIHVALLFYFFAFAFLLLHLLRRRFHPRQVQPARSARSR